MATPYTPSQLALSNFDATQAATATWLFSSPDATVKQQSFQIQFYNNTTGALAFDTGTLTSSLSQYVIPANTLVNRTVYKWRIMYTDSAGNSSGWSQYQLVTCSAVPTIIVTSPVANAQINSNVLTIAFSYAQAQSVAQQSYRVVIYASDQVTVIPNGDTGTVFGTANQFVMTGLSNGNYFAQVTVTSADGLTVTTGKIPFAIAYTGAAASPAISITPLPKQAALRVDWTAPINISGNYVGPGAVYAAGKFGQAVQVAAYGEKVYFTLAAAVTQFTLTSWGIAKAASSAMSSSQVLYKLMSDANNYLQIRYDPVTQSFVYERCVAGSVITAKSTSGIAFAAGAQLFFAIKQVTTNTTVSEAFVGVNGAFYTMIPAAAAAVAQNSFGVATFGSAAFTSTTQGVPAVRTVYLGCSDQNGAEANFLIDQTHMTSAVLTDAQIQALFTNATQQQFTVQSFFLANFDGNLQAGSGNGTIIDHWNVYRTFNGVQKQIGTVQNTGQVNGTFTDLYPLAGYLHQYSVVPVDANGNTGAAQSVVGSVDFDGWWLSDQTTGAGFQIVCELDDVAIKTNYQRAEYHGFGMPIPSYGPGKWRSGQISGKVVAGYPSNLTPFQQFQALQALVDSHKQLLLRGDEGWGFIVDVYDPTATMPHRGLQQWNKVQFEFVEVAPYS